MPGINFYSTNRSAPGLSFGEALLKGLAPDKGLYMPDEIPTLTYEEILNLSGKEYFEIAFEIISVFLKDQIEEEELLALVKDAYDFKVPLQEIDNNLHVMRLDQGPTASFKDFAARMMGRLMQYYLKKDKKSLLILTATSGDTGSAIANAFYMLDNIKVVVLYPDGEVSDRQRKQMTSLGENISILAIDGKFDDCQALVKEAFVDNELSSLNLSSANSINIGRLIPQIVYYFYAFSRLREGKEDDSVVFSIPSGNFGDMMGCVLAKKMGLPVEKLVISVNQNDEFPDFLKSGVYKPLVPSVNCLSNAMNVGHPSNLARLIELYGGRMDEKGNITMEANMEEMRNDIFSVSVSDEDTRSTIKEAYKQFKLILEPHGAVGWKGLMDYLNLEEKKGNKLCVSLETAHPAKFPDEIRELIGIDPELPESLIGLEDKEEFVVNLNNNYEEFKHFLLSSFDS